MKTTGTLPSGPRRQPYSSHTPSACSRSSPGLCLVLSDLGGLPRAGFPWRRSRSGCHARPEEKENHTNWSRLSPAGWKTPSFSHQRPFFSTPEDGRAWRRCPSCWRLFHPEQSPSNLLLYFMEMSRVDNELPASCFWIRLWDRGRKQGWKDAPSGSGSHSALWPLPGQLIIISSHAALTM